MAPTQQQDGGMQFKCGVVDGRPTVHRWLSSQTIIESFVGSYCNLVLFVKKYRRDLVVATEALISYSAMYGTNNATSNASPSSATIASSPIPLKSFPRHLDSGASQSGRLAFPENCSIRLGLVIVLSFVAFSYFQILLPISFAVGRRAVVDLARLRSYDACNCTVRT